MLRKSGCQMANRKAEKLPNKPPNRTLTQLPLHPVQPLPHTGKLLHLGLVVLPEHPHVGVMVHSLGSLRERLHHVSAAAEPLPDCLRPAKSTVHLVLPLALVDKIVAMTAQEIL